MSFKALSWAWDANTGSPGRKLVLVGLAQFANDKNECWPSQDTIAERTEQSQRTVREHLAWLENAGFLTRQARTGPGQFTSDAIRLNLDRLDPLPGSLPAAKSAVGEKPQPPAAKNGTDQRQISPPNLHMNLQGESPATPLTPLGEDLQVVGAWNLAVHGTILPQARNSPKRERTIAGRLKEAGWFEDFKAAAAGVAKSPFHLGQNERGWKADIDFLLQNGKATQLAEKLRTGPLSKAQGAPGFRSTADRSLIDQFAERSA